MLEVHLYGKLRRFAAEQDPTGDSVVCLPVKQGDTIRDMLIRLKVPPHEIGGNIFLNWRYSALNRQVQDGDRLAVFPDDMQLLYRWYFAKVGGEENDRG